MTITELVAEPIVDDIGLGEEMCLESTCRHCGGPVFMDFIEPPDGPSFTEDGERIYDETCFWQHNDDRYSPGKPSACGPAEKWEARRD